MFCILGLIIIFKQFGDDAKLVNAVPKMELKKDVASELFLFDLATDKGFGTPEFHTTVFDKRFLVKGVATTIIFSEINSEPTINSKLPFKVMFYSDILSPLCLDKISQKIKHKSFLKIDSNTYDAIIKFVEDTCGPKVHSNNEYAGSIEAVNSEIASGLCSTDVKCAKCLIIKGETKTGECESKVFEFKNTSAVRRNSGSTWITYENYPVTALDYLRYQRNNF